MSFLPAPNCRHIVPLRGQREERSISLCARDDARSSDASVDVRWKENVPKLGGRREEFDGHEGAFLVELGRADDVDFDLLLGLGIFEDELGALGKALGKNDHGAGGADGVGEAFDGFGFTGNVSEDAHAQQDALGAAAFLGGGLPIERGTDARRFPGLRVGRGFHVRI